MIIFYTLYGKLYVNITNACSCACIFCIRKGGEGVGSANSLWLLREPSLDEIKAAFDAQNLDAISEIVFCGYGEPMERASAVIKTCEYIRSKCSLPIRLNTNGLVRLIEPDFDMSNLRLFDSVSISLNADDKEEYLRVTKPRFGEKAYYEMLDFAQDAKEFTDVGFTVVDIIGGERIENCQKIAQSMGIPLRVRHFVKNNESYS